MANRILTLCTTILLWLGASQAHAIVLSFDPVSSDVTTGSSVDVNLVISDLGWGTAPSLGAFDLNVDYDASILGLSSAVFGDQVLGDQLDLFGLGSITAMDASLPGTVNLFQLSFDLAVDLNLLQADSFTLATLTFDTIGVGTSLLSYSGVMLGDSWGAPLDAALESGSITSRPSAVPEPASFALMGLGLLGLGFARKLRQSDQ